MRNGQDRTHLLRIAAGSAMETRAALRIAVAWGYVDETSLAHAVELLERLNALWRLTHAR